MNPHRYTYAPAWRPDGAGPPPWTRPERTRERRRMIGALALADRRLARRARRALAVPLAALALAAVPAVAGAAPAGPVPAPAVAARSAAAGWPHAITPPERHQITRHAAGALTRWIGARPARGGCTFARCTFAYAAGARVRMTLRTYEDGSLRILAVRTDTED